MRTESSQFIDYFNLLCTLIFYQFDIYGVELLLLVKYNKLNNDYLLNAEGNY